MRIARQRIGTTHGLSPLQIQVVELLGESPDVPRRVGSIATELGVSSPTVSDTIATLADKGLVERTDDPTDLRVTLVGLTRRGSMTASKISLALGPIMDATRELPSSDRGTALEVMLETIASLQRAGVISIDHSCLTCHHYQRGEHGGVAHCGLLDIDLEPRDLRVTCADHSLV